MAWGSGQRQSATDDTELGNRVACLSRLRFSTLPPTVTRPLPLDLPHNLRLPNSYSFLPDRNHNRILLSKCKSRSLYTHGLHMLPH